MGSIIKGPTVRIPQSGISLFPTSNDWLCEGMNVCSFHFLPLLPTNCTYFLHYKQEAKVAIRITFRKESGRIESLVLARNEANVNVILCTETTAPFQIPNFRGGVSNLCIKWSCASLVHILAPQLEPTYTYSTCNVEGARNANAVRGMTPNTFYITRSFMVIVRALCSVEEVTNTLSYSRGRALVS